MLHRQQRNELCELVADGGCEPGKWLAGPRCAGGSFEPDGGWDRVESDAAPVRQVSDPRDEMAAAAAAATWREHEAQDFVAGSFDGRNMARYGANREAGREGLDSPPMPSLPSAGSNFREHSTNRSADDDRGERAHNSRHGANWDMATHATSREADMWEFIRAVQQSNHSGHSWPVQEIPCAPFFLK